MITARDVAKLCEDLSKVYMVQYGSIWSMTVPNAIALAKDAIKNDTWDLNKYGKQLSRIATRNVHLYPNHYTCLDWGKEEWENFLNDMIELSKK